MGVIESAITVIGIFIGYVLRKTDAKIDKTEAKLALHLLEDAYAHSSIRADISKDFATKLELRDVEQRAVASNKEVQLKLDRIIDKLIDNPKHT